MKGAFIQRLRERIPTWRSLGLSAGSTSAIYLDGRVWIHVSVGIDGTAHALRVDLTEREWAGAWVTSGNSSLALDLAEALPPETVSGSMADPRQGIDDAVEWVERELRNAEERWGGPVKRRKRRR